MPLSSGLSGFVALFFPTSYFSVFSVPSVVLLVAIRSAAFEAFSLLLFGELDVERAGAEALQVNRNKLEAKRF